MDQRIDQICSQFWKWVLVVLEDGQNHLQGGVWSILKIHQNALPELGTILIDPQDPIPEIQNCYIILVKVIKIDVTSSYVKNCLLHHIVCINGLDQLKDVKIMNKMKMNLLIWFEMSYIRICFQIQNKNSKSVIVKWFLCVLNHHNEIFLQCNRKSRPLRFKQSLCHILVAFSSH